MESSSQALGGVRWAPETEGAPAHQASEAVFVDTASTTSGHRRLAAGAVAVSALVFFAVIPFAKTQLAALPPFIAVYQTALVVCDLVTATLLLGQARYQRTTPLWLLAAGYLFTGGIAVSHTLSFPGLFSSGGLLGATPQSSAWLYMFWHGGFPLFVVAYALLKEHTADTTAPRGSAIACGLAGALAAVLNHGRFDLGFYAGRVYGLLAASFVLVVMLVENGKLYARVRRLYLE